ncbi:hypothetical protein [Kibdelosporangium phytohabitans]|uniref:Uncharacterized protein n=1 Tax=Kibdelosporangium phytohabitans TaxID=860235 RepID=A0A0N7F3T4_9PSEU|nr:hypothetical protein [Kibdelosporangium phytohabitans]ALG09519.1 hypothetical protein AOZ06_23760 [Kibdelosporangium phytohabitans]MBE1469175.1 hypothetical protein [Kibdelosporangium phytohabitans]
MKIAALITLAVSLICTIMYVAAGIGGTGELAWVNGWMIGPVLLMFVVPVLFSVSQKLGDGLAALRGAVPRSFRDAPIGMGTVVGVARTGLSVNDQPQVDIQLDVDTPNGLSFRGTARQIIDVTELASVRPGAILPVRYLPDGQVTLAIDATQGELQAALNRVQMAKGHITPQQLHIAENGIDARAVVLALAPTGEIRHGRSVVSIKLRITRADGTMFDLNQHKAIPASAIPQLQPGAPITVRYLPQDESEVAIITALTP